MFESQTPNKSELSIESFKFWNEQCLALDELAINVQIVLKDYFRKGIELLDDCRIEVNNVLKAIEHINLLSYWDSLEFIIESWMYYDTKITVLEPNLIVINITDRSKFEEYFISNFRFNNFRVNIALTANLRSISSKCQFQTKKLPPIEYRNLIEITSCIFCAEYFFLDKELKADFLGIPLTEWIRAYIVIIQESKNFVNHHISYPHLMALSDWCLIRTKKKWIKLFELAGIKSLHSKIIFDNLVFNSKSKDLLDCPFIPIKDKYLIVPSICLKIHPANSIYSNLPKRVQS